MVQLQHRKPGKNRIKTEEWNTIVDATNITMGVSPAMSGVATKLTYNDPDFIYIKNTGENTILQYDTCLIVDSLSASGATVSNSSFNSINSTPIQVVNAKSTTACEIADFQNTLCVAQVPIAAGGIGLAKISGSTWCSCFPEESGSTYKPYLYLSSNKVLEGTYSGKHKLLATGTEGNLNLIKLNVEEPYGGEFACYPYGSGYCIFDGDDSEFAGYATINNTLFHVASRTFSSFPTTGTYYFLEATYTGTGDSIVLSTPVIQASTSYPTPEEKYFREVIAFVKNGYIIQTHYGTIKGTIYGDCDS